MASPIAKRTRASVAPVEAVRALLREHHVAERYIVWLVEEHEVVSLKILGALDADALTYCGIVCDGPRTAILAAVAAAR